MADQQEIDGIRPMKHKVPQKRMVSLVMNTGAQEALRAAEDELKEIQKQHQSVAGLTLAIAVIARRFAEARMDVSRQVLIQAASGNLPIEHHAIAMAFKDDGLWLEATGESTATEQAHG